MRKIVAVLLAFVLVLPLLASPAAAGDYRRHHRGDDRAAAMMLGLGLIIGGAIIAGRSNHGRDVYRDGGYRDDHVIYGTDRRGRYRWELPRNCRWVRPGMYTNKRYIPAPDGRQYVC